MQALSTCSARAANTYRCVAKSRGLSGRGMEYYKCGRGQGLMVAEVVVAGVWVSFLGFLQGMALEAPIRPYKTLPLIKALLQRAILGQ